LSKLEMVVTKILKSNRDRERERKLETKKVLQQGAL